METLKKTVTGLQISIYILDKQVTVEAGTTLTIDPGTVIKANPQEAPNVSMLVVARGGKING